VCFVHETCGRIAVPLDVGGKDACVRPIPGAAGAREEKGCLLWTLIDPDPIVSARKASPIDRLESLNWTQRYLVYEFVEDYRDGLMSRRDLLSRVVHIAGGTAAGLALLAALGVSAEEIYAQESTPTAQQRPAEPRSPLSVAADDPRVIGTDIAFPSGDATIMAYEARPAGGMAATPVGDGRTALVLVCHENRGLTEHIRDVTRRLAVNGYTACALDLVSREGGTASISDPSSIPDFLTAGNPNRHVLDVQAAIAFYGNDGAVDASRVGMIGF
jgi:carboxymethylenebutenolidase